MGRVRWIVLVVVAIVVLVVGGIGAVVLVEHPELDDARAAVDRAWQPLRAPAALVARYQKLEGALSAFDAAGGQGRAVSNAIHAGLTEWQQALARGDAGEEAAAANELEGQATRLQSDVLGTEKFHTVRAVTDAVTSFAASQPASALVDAYNAAVRRYEHVRTGTLARPVASTFGYSARPALALSGS